MTSNNLATTHYEDFRLNAHLSAELASGQVLAPAIVQQLTAEGCQIEIVMRDTNLPYEIRSIGLLHIKAVGRNVPNAILPVRLRNMRCEGHVLRYDIEFRQLMSHQVRKLSEILSALSDDIGSDYAA